MSTPQAFKIRIGFWLCAVLLLLSAATEAQTLSLSLSNSPTGQVTPGTVITYTMTLGTSINDTNVVVTGHIPAGTTLVAGSAQHIGGLAPTGINAGIPSFTYATLGSAQTSTIRYQVTVNSNTQPGLITNNNTRAASNGSSTRFATAVSNINVPSINNGSCACLNDADVNVINGTYSSTLVVRHPTAGVPLSIGQSYVITAASNLALPDGNNIGLTGGSLVGFALEYCGGAGCPPGVVAGEYYRQVHVATAGTFSVTVSTPGGGSITRSVATPCNAYPALPTIPLMDNECLVGITSFASSGGVYNIFNTFGNPGDTVLYDGFSQVGTGNLTINPLQLNPAELPYSIHLRREVAGCASTSFKDTFNVYKTPVATLQDRLYECRVPGSSLILTDLFVDSTTSGGLFTVNGIALPQDSTRFTFNTQGCNVVQYEATHPVCASTFDTKRFFVTLRPDPAITLTSGTPSPVCLFEGTTSVTVSRTSNGASPVLTVTPTPQSVSGNIASGNVTVTFAAPASNTSVVYTICLEERAASVGAFNCGSLSAPTDSCARQICRKFTVYNDGYSCGANNLFASQCPDPFQPEPCDAEVRPSIEISCGGYFTITLPDLFSSEITTDQGVLNCTDLELTGTYNISILGLDFNSLTGGQKIRDFPGLSVICNILSFCIKFKVPVINVTINLGCPLKAIADAIGCDKTIAQFIFDLIGKLIGGDGGGGVVVADTDGDGAFDFQIDEGSFPLGELPYTVPNRVSGSGYITVRAVGGWPFAPIDVCGQVTPDGPNLIDLLPIGAIPIVGAVIEDILASLQCNIPLAWSSVETVQVPVINVNPPDFVNCNPAGYVFTNTLECEIPVNWSVPAAINPCDNTPISYRGVTNGVDLSFYAGQNPPVPVILNEAGIYQTAGPVPGSVLPPGVYPVTYIAVSCNGNPQTCTFNVVVTSGDPILECPSDITVFTEVDQCIAVVNGLAPYQGIGCNSLLNYRIVNPVSGTIVETMDSTAGVHNVPDGYAFELGTSEVTYTLEVDINGDGDTDDPGETQICSFNVVVEDGQLPTALCVDVEVKLDNTGNIQVYAQQQAGSQPFINGGSSDNCDSNLEMLIAKAGGTFESFVNFDCTEIGVNIVTLRVTDQAGNSRSCIARVDVGDFLDDIDMVLDLPELCLESVNPEQLNFANYLTITLPNGQYITHNEVSGNSYLGDFEGGFGISGFIPFPGSASNDPGTITEDGIYTPGEGSGSVIISYLLYLPTIDLPEDDNPAYAGCVAIVHSVFQLYQPLEMDSPECVCGDGLERTVSLGVITGGLEPYTIQFQGSTLDIDGDGTPDDVDGEYTYDAANGHNINDFQQTLGTLRVQYTQPTWSFTIVDARGCELYRSGSCDNDDLTVGPEIPSLPDTTIFTKFYFCESNLAWRHPLPWDNCAVVKYNWQVNNPDGTVSGPFELTNLVNQAPGAPIDSLFLASFDFELGTSVVLYYAEDAVGNFVTNQFLVTVVDDDPPYYINCPYPPIVQDAEFGQCDAYVTFSLPIAFDNCALPPSNTQIDSTGLTTGSRFPVGTTVLYWEAIDNFNNRDTCQVKVIVNDFGNYPTLACPQNQVVVNDPWLCSAIVDDIAPTFDNICIDNTRITYSVFKDAALTDRQYCGVWDASGETFDKGTSWIRYTVAGQPLFLITEVAQNGAVDQLEITNLGPAAIDITCLQIERKGANPLADEIIGPISLLPALDGIILGVGEVMVFDFTFNAPGNMGACYTISYMGTVFDQVAVNGFANCSGFTGTLASGNVYRHCEDDSNDASDWALETLCSPLTMGVLNPELDVMPDNGTLTALQSILPNSATCVFTVEVLDAEKPFCGELADNTTTYNGGPITGISPTSCNRSTITVPEADGCIIGNIVFNLTGTATPSNSTITLISPTGIRVGITELPADTLVDLFAQKSEGIWTLDIVPNPGQTPTVTAWSLAITCIEPYSQPDVTIDNDPGLCGAEFTWTHAYFIDNCFEGTITVQYTTEDAECAPEGGVLAGVSPKGWFGGYEVTEFFCVGTTKVTYILEDVAGNVDSCAFLVTVQDVEDPVVTCPQNIFINLEPGLCRKVVCYYPAFTDDNCAVVDTIYEPPFCSEFEIGIHDVSITVVDEAGNDQTCTFQVHIIEYIPQDKSLKCNDLVQVSLGFDCLSEIYADDILEGNNYRCYEKYEVTVYSGLSPAQPVLATSPFVTGNEAGKQLLVLVTDPETGNSCWGKISVEDKQPPIIACPADVTIGCSQSALPAITGTPTVDDCSPTTSTPNDVYTDLGQCGNPRARIEREWKVTDASNNNATCKQQITIAGFSLADLAYPADITISCADVPFPSAATPSITGKPSINGTPIDQPGGVCDASYTFSDEVFDICPRSYEILRTWKVRNTCLPLGPNNPSQHVQLIAVLDQQPPTLTCPTEHDVKFGATKKVGSKDCVTNVMLPWVQITDNCSANSALQLWVYTTLPDGTISTVNTPNQAGFFVFELPVGATYTFTYVAKDGCGNVNECSITLEVRDATPPSTICETFHTVSLTDSVTRVDAISFDDGSYDDCSEVTFAVRRGTMNAAGAFVQHPCNLPGDFLFSPQVRFYCCDAVSQTPLFVDLRIRDAWGNDNHCMVEVEVVDKVRPVIWCPEDITVQCGMPFEPTGTDTFQICKQPDLQIKNAFAAAYPIPVDIFGIPGDARITDLDLGLQIDHEQVNDLIITLYSPLGLKATVLNGNACSAQSVNIARDIRVTFNDQAYDIAFFNQTGVRNPALFTCTQAIPSVGAYNQGQMKPQGDELKIFNGQPLNSFTAKDKCFTASAADINPATNRISGFQVQQFILGAGLQANDRVLMEYSSATGQPLEGLSTGLVYLFQVINSNTIELLSITGDDILSVAPGSSHMFCVSGTWLLVIEDTKPLAGGLIKEVCLNIGYAQPTGLKPNVTDNTEECGLNVTHQDLGQPDKCADGTFINRRWTVADNFGNNTSCIQRVYFTDDSPLTVQFPCDVTVNCPVTPDATGEVKHNTDCEQSAIEFTDHTLVTTDGCYKILRTWVVKDWCTYEEDGNTDFNVTSINESLNEISFTTAINALITSRKIAIGDRVTLRYVTIGSTEIPGMIEGDVYSLVRVSGTTFRVDFNTTKQQSVNITGQGVGPHVFRFANSELGLPVACDVLLEWYPFVDWYTSCCNPLAVRRAWEDDGDGYFRFVQEIKVVDNVAPQWVNCADLEFCSFEEDCEPTMVEILSPAIDNCADSTQLSYNWTIDLFNDGTVDLEGVSSDASGAYPNGTHRVVFKVSDRCGNWNTCTRLFTIRDCKKPTPICINGLSVDLMPTTGMATVWASSLEAGDSYDNCTEYDNLTILVERFSNLTPGQAEPSAGTNNEVVVTCDDLPPTAQSPEVEVVVWVGDEAGNWDYCVTTIWVQDNMGACGDPQNAQLVAYFYTEEQEPVSQVEVEMTGSMQATQVAMGGTATFQGVPYGQPAVVTPHKDIMPLNGVSTYDLLLIQKHLLGIKSLNSPYKLIAADVNNSCGISVSDIIELRKMILNPGLDFKNNTSWRFVDSKHVFANPTKPCGFPEIKSFGALGVMNNANFVAIKIGDVSADAAPNSLLGGNPRNYAGTLAFHAGDAELRAGEEHTVILRAGDFLEVQGYQFTIDADSRHLRILEVTPLWDQLTEANFGRENTAYGAITTSWNGSEGVTLAKDSELFAVRVQAISEVTLSEVLKVNSRVTRAEAYDANEELLQVEMRFDGAVPATGFVLYQNEPNPFSSLTRIGFELPVAGEALLTVHDITGKVVYRHQGEYPRGFSELLINRAELPGTGMLYYTLQSGEHIATLRMTLLD